MELLRNLNKLRVLIARKDKLQYLFLVFLTFFASLLEGIGVGAVPACVAVITNPEQLRGMNLPESFLSHIPENPSITFIIWASVALILLFLGKGVFLSILAYYQSWIAENQRTKLAQRMFRCYLNAPYDWFLQRNSSELTKNILMDTARISNGIMTPIMNLIMAVGTLLFVLPILIIVSPNHVIGILVVLALCSFLFVYLLKGKLTEIGTVLKIDNRVALSSVSDGLAAIIDARITKTEPFLTQSVEGSLSRIAHAKRVLALIQAATKNIFETVGVGAVLLIIILLMREGNDITAILPLIAMIVVAFVRLKSTATVLINNINQIIYSNTSLPHILKDIEEIAGLNRVYNPPSRHRLAPTIDEIELRNVKYAYPKTDQSAIQDISLKIKRGESIGFLGPTGCGKSTLINILVGLLKPDAGDVCVNGISIYGNLDGWHEHIGYIPQHIFLLDDTISANVAFGVDEKDIDHERVDAALNGACLYDFVMSLPKKKKTIVGERGARISGGQRQRLGIARALYRDPDLLIMDEATSALDNETELKVMEAIEGSDRNRTVVMIAHRLNTLKNCGTIYELNAGKMIRSGTYDEVVERNYT
jgi:ATP-binding cassette, subfamily B, bacterial PglK